MTIAYSNAVIAAVLPHISDFANKLDVPIPQPIVMTNIVYCGIAPYQPPESQRVSIGIKGDRGEWGFGFANGYMGGFEDLNSYAGVGSSYDFNKCYGTVNMTKDEAVAMARETILKLGISLESVFAEQEPVVEEPYEVKQPNGTKKTIPHYNVKWRDPRDDDRYSVRIQIDGEKKKIEGVSFYNDNLKKPPMKLAVDVQYTDEDATVPVNMEYVKKLIPYVTQAIDDYGKRMFLSIPYPLTTNQIKKFSIHNRNETPFVAIELTDGWGFTYWNTRITAHYAPDAFFAGYSSPFLIKNYTNTWNMTESEAIALARKTIKKFDCDTNLFQFLDEKPTEIQKPFTTGKTIIPRYKIRWEHTEKLPPIKPEEGRRTIDEKWMATAIVEVDAGTKTVKSVYFIHDSFFNHGPPIDVPITIRKPNEPAPALNPIQ